MAFIKLEIHGNAFENCKCLSTNFQNFGNAFPKIKYPFIIFANLFPKSMEIHGNPFQIRKLKCIFIPGGLNINFVDFNPIPSNLTGFQPKKSIFGCNPLGWN
jgi:hypothetical protein